MYFFFIHLSINKQSFHLFNCLLLLLSLFSVFSPMQTKLEKNINCRERWHYQQCHQMIPTWVPATEYLLHLWLYFFLFTVHISFFFSTKISHSCQCCLRYSDQSFTSGFMLIRIKIFFSRTNAAVKHGINDFEDWFTRYSLYIKVIITHSFERRPCFSCQKVSYE